MSLIRTELPPFPVDVLGEVVNVYNYGNYGGLTAPGDENLVTKHNGKPPIGKATR